MATGRISRKTKDKANLHCPKQGFYSFQRQELLQKLPQKCIQTDPKKCSRITTTLRKNVIQLDFDYTTDSKTNQK